MTTEADTCRKFIVPKLQAAGLDNDPHSIAEQRNFTNGRIVVRGTKAERRKCKRADYILRYTRDFPLEVVESKLRFNILNYTCTATRNFTAPPTFDDDPAFATQEEIDESGRVKETKVVTPEEQETTDPVAREVPPTILDWILDEKRKFYFDGGRVEIAAHLVYELDADGKQLRVVELTDYTGEKVRTLCPTRDQFRNRWQNAEQRSEIIQQLAERGIDFQAVAIQAGKPDADPFDLLCHLAFNAPLLTRRQRVERLKKHEAAFFNRFGPEAREILTLVLEKYANDGELQFTLPDVLKVPPISDHRNVNEIINKFGGPDKLRTAVNQLQSLLYAA